MDTIATLGRQPLPDKRHAPSLYARDWSRVVAFVTDFVIVYLLTWILVVLLAILVIPEVSPAVRIAYFSPPGPAPLVFVLVAWLYYALCESSRGQATLGKRWLRLQVTDRYGRRIGFGRATGRLFGMYLSALPCFLGFLIVDLTPRKQTLHDWIAGCCVVTRAGLDAFQRGESDATTVPGSPIAGVVAPSRRNA